ncbi:heterokaryon incompatibility protein-domain-containing protein [Daldinia vernicosa]|uniref:heterokaryon incompatibility protein-domain-containing protein n=1 Tax=Daldinia vernicosa TaxID=114800 RepID=UPI002007DCE2|nr:heterokaryon incompatibility protein-domain-containing protein [Daldinia vernicosa]KAI0852446.1 heterokaryon incompatibility protein-domain-containing protein [Daldinia vernicosa]
MMGDTQVGDNITEERCFVHTPMTDARNQIRLLQIHHAKRDEPVHCSLSTWSLSKLPPYHAISYTWGDPSQTTYISINKQPLKVRRSCEYVLRQAKWHERNLRNLCAWRHRYYWIDAICINQTDNEEKSHQVQMMGKIYRLASCVLSCIGPHADNSKFLLDFVRRNYFYLKSAFTANGNRKPSKLGQLWLAGLGNPRSALSVSMQVLGRAKRAKDAFIRRPYFTRLWILQEMFAARKVHVCCGEDSVPMDYLRAFRPSLTRSSPRYRNNNTPQEKLTPSTIEERICWVHFANYGCTEYVAPLGLYTALGQSMFLCCQDPRDKIYGILTVTGWNENGPLSVDYKKSLFEVAVDTLRAVAQDARVEFHWDTTLWPLTGRIFQCLNIEACPYLKKALDSRRTMPRLNDTEDSSPMTYLHETAEENRVVGSKTFATVCRPLCTFKRWLGLRIVSMGGILGFLFPFGNGQQQFIKGNGSLVEMPLFVRCPSGEFRKSTNLETVSFLLPAGTRDGDWIIFRKCRSRRTDNQEPGCILAVRQRGGVNPRRYDICGQAVPMERGRLIHGEECEDFGFFHQLGTDWGSFQDGFDVHFDVEDLLVLVAQLNGPRRSKSDREHGDEQIRRIRTSVCRFDGSSYAVAI